MTYARSLNRRQLLGTVLGASAASLVVPVLKPSALSDLPSAGRAAADQTLVVVFHGVFAFLFGAKGDDVTILVPKVPGHVYWAGDFGHEDQNDLPPKKSLRLSGVSAGGWAPASFDFQYLGQPPVVKNKSLLYTTMILPWPDDLVLDREIPAQAGQDFFLQPSGLKATKFSTIFSFVYQNGTIKQRPALDGTAWKALRSWGQPGGAMQAVLHVRAENCGSMGTVNGWDVLSDLFGLTGPGRIVLNERYYGSSPTNPPKGIPGVVSAGEDDFLLEELGCKPGGLVMFNTPINCASIGGPKG